MRRIVFLPLLFALLGVAGCGYHMLGAAAHMPPDVKTLSVPVFATRTDAYHTEVVVTNAVIRELTARTRLRVTPDAGGDPDAVLHGTILRETVAPLTGRDGKVLHENKNYIFRQQYQSTADLSVFLEENPAAKERLSREFARALVADVLEGF
jgi:hypothetical protein